MWTEDWTKEIDGMWSTVVVEVFPAGRVNVSDEMVDELGLDRLDGVDTPSPLRSTFVWNFPYETVAAALEKNGWQRASSS